MRNRGGIRNKKKGNAQPSTERERPNTSRRIPHIAIQNFAFRQLSCSAGAKLQPSLPSPSSFSLLAPLPSSENTAEGSRAAAADVPRHTSRPDQRARGPGREVCVCHNRWWALELKYFILHLLHQIRSCNQRSHFSFKNIPVLTRTRFSYFPIRWLMSMNAGFFQTEDFS